VYKVKPLTKRQRDRIVERDEHQSQMRTYTEKDGWTNKVHHCPFDGQGCKHLQVHHIVPRRCGGTNEPDNLITLCSCQHIGKCPDRRIDGHKKYADPKKHFVVHPDMIEAYKGYDGTNNTMEQVFARRQEKVERGETFHNTLHDEEMLETAALRTKRTGWYHRKRKK
jgi:hypothetical protein